MRPLPRMTRRPAGPDTWTVGLTPKGADLARTLFKQGVSLGAERDPDPLRSLASAGALEVQPCANVRLDPRE